MLNPAPRVYNSVHFHEYLDNGDRDVYLQDLHALMNGKTIHSDTNYHPFTGSTAAKQQIPPLYETLESIQPADRTQLDGHHRKNEWFKVNMVNVCEEMLGCKIVDVSFPGGIFRKSFRLHAADGRSVIATRRQGPGRARLEERVLLKLSHQAGPVPQIYAFNGLLLLQQDLPGVGVDNVFENSDETTFFETSKKALASLAGIHRLAEQEGLDHSVPMMGYDADWLITFLDRTAVIGNFLRLPCPPIPGDVLFDLLVLLKPRFVKWDARPGNAILDDEGETVKWFDWEHCAARNRLDDMAWFLCDEKVPDYAATEDEIIKQYLMDFADGRSFDHAHDYLRLYGMLHMCVRLGRLLDLKGNHSWQQLDQLLQKQPGISLMLAKRLCTRASRWADNMQAVAHLKDWFLQIGARLDEV